MASTITITFTERPPVDATLTLFSPNYLGQSGLNTFKNQRLAPFQSTLFNTGDLGLDLSRIANAYAVAIQLDYNISGRLNIDQQLNVVQIQSDDDNVFDGWSKSPGWDISVVLSNVPNVEDLNIDSVTYLQADSDFCNKVKVRVNANKYFTDLVLPIAVTQTANDFIEFDFNRSTNYELQIQNSLADSDYQGAPFNSTPPVINEQFIDIVENTTPNGVNITIGYSAFLGIVNLEYSLDNTNWQSSDTFTGLVAGIYTIYIRDQFGCVRNTTHIIGASEAGQGTAPPLFYYPDSNPIIMRFDKPINNCENLTYRDLLSQSENNLVTHNYVHPFKDCDSTVIQFRTSYGNTNVELLDCNGDLVRDMDVTKITNNINNYDARDAFKYLDSDGYVRLFFTQGNIYDDTSAVTGTHYLNGNYPSGYEVGGYVKFDGAYELIRDIIYNISLERWEIITGQQFFNNIGEVAVVASIFYNVQPYEIYEATIDLTGLNGFYQLNLTSGYTGENIRITGLSEVIEVSNELENHHILVYGSTRNNDIIYGYGYKGFARFKYDVKPVYAPVDEIDDYQSEDDLISLESYNRNRYEFSFFMLSTASARQLNEILKNDVIFIDGIEYKKVGTPETSVIGSSNSYMMKVVMQEQSLNSYLDQPYIPQSSDGGGSFAFTGDLISSNGFLINSNGLVSNG